ncbi:TIGR03936 family radical SAM-associated protein [Kitasatospora sp. Ki12]|uniref:TIGR03936 family radical SAM-associated protein n=1 Tax=Kitasatospora xanthocidica TaxID=83382 RepID=UPI00167B294B|nr:TIGR03936 family radical SAM-associated protein [Kitasatospora xanthocidica]GHF79902.1 radical SAM protein [Kitasatospora xanthocidica]
MQRIRLRYTKRGRLRFTSHRDFQRAFERALRRSAVPMAYSAGFTPHPKVSYANAAPTGVASEAEYLEIGLAAVRDPEQLRAQLDESLPNGLDVIDAVEVRTPNFVERLEASEWLVRLDGVEPDEAAGAVARFLAEERVEVERVTKNGVRVFDARGAVAALDVLPPQVDGGADTEAGTDRDVRTGRPCAILRLVVRHATPAVRPDDVLSGLRATADLAPPVPAEVTRLAQGPLDEGTGTVTDPLALDRAAAPAGSEPDAGPRATAPA